jgi:hypothetical protein
MRRAIIILAVLVVLAVPGVAMAGDNSATGIYWRVTGIWNSHSPEGHLIGRKLRYSRNLNPKDDYEY